MAVGADAPTVHLAAVDRGVLRVDAVWGVGRDDVLARRQWDHRTVLQPDRPDAAVAPLVHDAEIAEHFVERAVLLEDHDDMLDLPARTRGRAWSGTLRVRH